MLHIHRAERADALVEGLGAVLATPLPDPMTAELVAVPTRGVERWVTQRLSGRLGAGPRRGDGVCANIEFPFPGRLVGDALAAATGIDRDADPWLAERTAWPLLEVVDASLNEPWLGVLAHHLGANGGEGDPLRRGRRFGAVRRVAALFDRYGVHRPDMLRDWAAGTDSDGAGGSLPGDARWQAELWRRLRQRIGHSSPAERLEHACSVLRDDPGVAGLPERVFLFGLTRLPASHLEVLRALGSGREVHLLLLHPSPALWERVAREGRSAEAGCPLLASWGRDARELQVVIAPGPSAEDHHHPLAVVEPVTLLDRIQADIRADRAPPGIPPPGGTDTRAPLDPSDRSLSVHACHGRARQVEVVRDAVLGLLAADETLEPRDVIVMCPDVEAFAPLVHATFGAAAEAHDDSDDSAGRDDGYGRRLPDLRVRLADRSLRQTNPVLGVVAALVDMAPGRLTGPEVLDLAGREPVRRRFRFDDADLARLDEWVAATGIRWGLDGPHRATYALDKVECNTWRSGLDRVLVGVAVAEDAQRLVGGVLPLDDVESGAIDLAGRFAEFVDRLGAAIDAFSTAKPIGDWVAAIGAAADALTATGPADAWQGAGLRRLLDDILAESAGTPAGTPTPGTTAGQPTPGTPVGTPTPGAASPGPALELMEVSALLADRLRGRPTRANFRTGHLTVCTLVPMRSVPHRVVCLLGLDDGSFPRPAPVDGDDLVTRNRRAGDRDARSEDRQLLLDAVLAATDHLVIAYAGRDERTNAERPPAVPVGELLDVVDATVRSDDRRPARDRVVVHHPLQPFDPKNFTSGDGAIVAGAGAPWSFDAVALDGARAITGTRRSVPPFLDQRLGPVPAEVIALHDLVGLVSHPVKAFLRQRLGFTLSGDPTELSGSLPVELDNLEQWGVGQRILEARLAGADSTAAVAAEVARGVLPPGLLAYDLIEPMGQSIEALVAEAGGAEGTSVEVNLRLRDGRALVGTVTGVDGSVIRAVTYSRLGPRQRLSTWVRFLALTATHPEQAVEAVTVGRNRNSRSRRPVSVARLGALADDAAGRRERAARLIEVLVDLYDRGMREPLPVYCKTSAAYAEARRAGNDARYAAAGAWESSQFDQEDRELEHRLVLGGQVPLARLFDEPPLPDESGAGWDDEEASRFGRYARRLWGPVLEHERVADR